MKLGYVRELSISKEFRFAYNVLKDDSKVLVMTTLDSLFSSDNKLNSGKFSTVFIGI
jgi:hypothetical protein